MSDKELADERTEGSMRIATLLKVDTGNLLRQQMCQISNDPIL
jgi:hypothetical protein